MTDEPQTLDPSGALYAATVVAQTPRAPRYAVRFRLLYDDAEGYSSAWVVDVSRTGMLLETAESLPIGTTLRFESDTDHGVWSQVSGRVVRVEEPDDPMSSAITRINYGLVRIGVAFIDIAPELADAVEKVVT